MPLPFSSAGLIEKNKLVNDHPWIVLFEIQLPDGTSAYLAKNNEPITWRGAVWEPIPVLLSDTTQDMKAMSTFTVQVSNVSGVIQAYLEQYNGLVDCVVVIRLVHTAHLDNHVAEIEETFNVQSTAYDEEWVTFTLGADFWMYYRALADRYLPDFCCWKYGKVKCGVPAATLLKFPSCGHTLADCKKRGNAKRFGGAPGMGGFYASNI
jgi:lambda family phage minor tail protein L